MKIIKNHALQEAFLLLAGSAALVWYSLDGYARAFDKDWTQSPFLFPIVIAGVLALLAVLIALQGIRSLNRETGEEAKDEAKAEGKTGGTVRVLVIIGMCAVYYFSLSLIRLPYMGVQVWGITLRFSTFELMTLLFTAAMMLFMGVRNKIVLICVPLGSMIFLSIMFRSLLHVILP